MNGLNKKLFLFLAAGIFLFLLTTVSAECGDGTCDGTAGENQWSCPSDCGEPPPEEYCGDGSCNGDETCSSCPNDCGSCGPVCGQYGCEAGEDQYNCPTDCGEPTTECGEGPIPGIGCMCHGQMQYSGWCCPNSWQKYECGSQCGNSICEGGEENTCPGDCGYCGNTYCEAGEDQYNCPNDCGSPSGYCGDGTCDPGEDQYNCPVDCGSAFCGNYYCEEGEDQQNCPIDCGGYGNCGNQICEQGEEYSCPGDCHICGDEKCDYPYENEYTCHDDCTGGEPPTTCGNNFCDQGETNENCPQDCQYSSCGNGFCESYNGEDSYNCPVDCENYTSCGNNTCEPGEEYSCPGDCGICGNNYCDPGEEMNCPGDCFQCGDGICNGSESYMTCHDDCPPPTCGNGKCDNYEWEKNCPQDCKPNAVCGDNYCEWHLGENPQSCSVDCGYQEPKCGNKICEEGENPSNCKDDCFYGECGDGFCGMGENPENCKDDCGMVVQPPVNYCPPKESLEEYKQKCHEMKMQFSLHQGYDGCLYGECNPEHFKPPLGDCKEVVEPNGFVRMECEYDCGPEPPEIKERCIEQRGTPRISTDPRGCEITVCEFGDTGRRFIGDCPSFEETEEKIFSCKEQGLKPIIEHSFSGCEYVKCAGEFRRDECPVHNFEEIEDIRETCYEKGGELIKHFDDRGCGVPRCIMEGEQDEYCKDVSPAAFERCEEEGGEFLVKKDEEGCVVFAKCSRRGDTDYEYEEIEVPDATKLLSLVLKLEEVKINLDKVRKKLSSLADYYIGENDSVNAERLEKAISMLSLAEERIVEITEKIRDNAKTMDKETIRQIKKEIRSVLAIIDNATLVLLGADDTGGETETDCGTDEECFQDNYAICNPATFTHIETNEGNKKFYAEIIGLEEGKCVMKVKAEFQGKSLHMTCEDPDYVDAQLSDDKIRKFCTGPLVEMMKTESGPAGPDYPGPQERIGDYEGDYIDDYGEYKDGLGKDVEGCKETFDAQGNKYITCPEDEAKETEPYSPLTGNYAMGIDWR